MEEDKLKIDMDNMEMFWVWKDENGNEKRMPLKPISSETITVKASK